VIQPKHKRPTRLRQQWSIYASLLTLATGLSLKRPVVVTETLDVVERTFAYKPEIASTGT